MIREGRVDLRDKKGTISKKRRELQALALREKRAGCI